MVYGWCGNVMRGDMLAGVFGVQMESWGKGRGGVKHDQTDDFLGYVTSLKWRKICNILCIKLHVPCMWYIFVHYLPFWGGWYQTGSYCIVFIWCHAKRFSKEFIYAQIGFF